jgi:D-galacturonate reductase
MVSSHENSLIFVQVDHLRMVGVHGGKFPAIRKHLIENIGGAYKDMDVS